MVVDSWADDPLSVDEIGCIHTCQGIDLDYCEDDGLRDYLKSKLITK